MQIRLLDHLGNPVEQFRFYFVSPDAFEFFTDPTDSDGYADLSFAAGEGWVPDDEIDRIVTAGLSVTSSPLIVRMVVHGYEDYEMVYHSGDTKIVLAPPIEVWTASDLNDIRDSIPNRGNYIQMADIDLSGYANWIPIGQDVHRVYPRLVNFMGMYNGNGFKLNNLKISNIHDDDHAGLFGVVNRGIIRNVALLDADATGGNNTGGLVGRVSLSFITKCCCTGSVSSNRTAGGLIGQALFGSTITECFFYGIVTGGPDEWSVHVGGLIGSSKAYDPGNISITNCYSKGSVIGGTDIDSYTCVGGLIGSSEAYEGNISITNCYSTGSVIGGTEVGGLIGYDYETTIISAYYDSQTSGQSDTGKGEPRTTLQMTDPYESSTTYLAWDFDTIWHIHISINDGYPCFEAYVEPPPVAPEDHMDLVWETPCSDLGAPNLIKRSLYLNAILGGGGTLRITYIFDNVERYIEVECPERFAVKRIPMRHIGSRFKLIFENVEGSKVWIKNPVLYFETQQGLVTPAEAEAIPI